MAEQRARDALPKSQLADVGGKTKIIATGFARERRGSGR